MKNRQRISRRVLRHFLQLAAATFAIGANVSPASAAEENLHGKDQQDDNKYAHNAPARADQAAYPLSFALPGSGTAAIATPVRSDIRVLDRHGRKLVQMTLDGPSMVGPFDHGAYTLLIKTQGMTEVHRLRIGTDTLPYLHFTETA